MSKEELWSLYGQIGNHRVVPIRSLCRARLVGMDTFAVRANLQRSLSEARQTAESIEMLNGSKEAAERARKIVKVFEFWLERPRDVRQMILNRYSKQYEGADSDVSVADYSGDCNTCPYEDNPDKRSCWSCHVPVKVWGQMESVYDKENGS